MEPVRISKYFTDCGVLSRRAAEQEIIAGNVKVNGKTAQLGQKIIPGTDKVEFNSKPVVLINTKSVYIMLNKPRGYVSTMSDEKDRHTVTELCANVGTRVYPVGRLDMDSDGLLIMTNDGQLTNKLTHPSNEIKKYYEVLVSGKPSPEQLAQLALPHRLDGYMTKPAEVHNIGSDGTNTLIGMTIHEGRNRQIRRICEEHGLSILRLTRMAEGMLLLGDLKPGRWRFLTNDEIHFIKSIQ